MESDTLVDGVLNIIKPPGMTSFDVVAFLRRLLGTKKIGHAGTLDPLAVGVLPVFTGRATKAIEYFMEKDKLYRVELTLGTSTDTQDSSGNVIKAGCIEASPEEIKKVIYSFLGEYEQVPPMYSAVRYNGKKLYELARNGIEIERKPRKVHIHFINMLDFRYLKVKESDNIDNYNSARAIIDVFCSKGTYIRTLCHDIGEALGCGGYMSFLLRLEAGVFNLPEAWTLEEIIEMRSQNRISEAMVSIDKLFTEYPCVVLNEKEYKRFMNGAVVNVATGSHKTGLTKVYDNNKSFVALGRLYYSENGCFLKSEKFFT